MLEKDRIYLDRVLERTEMRRLVFFDVNGLDGYFKDLDMAEPRFHEHIHLILKAVSLCFQKLCRDGGGEASQPRLRVFDFCPADPFENELCYFVPVSRSERNVFFIPCLAFAWVK